MLSLSKWNDHYQFHYILNYHYHLFVIIVVLSIILTILSEISLLLCIQTAVVRTIGFFEDILDSITKLCLSKNKCISIIIDICTDFTEQ